MFIYAYVHAQEDLTSMLTFTIYTMSIGPFIYVIKFPGQTSSPHHVETRKRCVPNLNDEYIGN